MELILKLCLEVVYHGVHLGTGARLRSNSTVNVMVKFDVNVKVSVKISVYVSVKVNLKVKR